MIGISTKNKDKIKENYNLLSKENSFNGLDKEKILKKIIPENLNIREKDNILSDNQFDSIINKCVVDSVNEIISKERYYSNVTEPLPWSNRTKILRFKYNNSEFSKKQFKNKIISELDECNNMKMGLINENFPDMDNEILINEREKRLSRAISKDVNSLEDCFSNYDIEETSVKIQLSELVLDQLLNEIVEIMEHISLNRTNPALYQGKSIYACDDIPKLSFQQVDAEMNENSHYYNQYDNSASDNMYINEDKVKEKLNRSN